VSVVVEAVARLEKQPTAAVPTEPVVVEEKASGDDGVLRRIREVLKERPSYGYRFVTAMLNGPDTKPADRVNHNSRRQCGRRHRACEAQTNANAKNLRPQASPTRPR
jgi:hypothetical protein